MLENKELNVAVTYCLLMYYVYVRRFIFTFCRFLMQFLSGIIKRLILKKRQSHEIYCQIDTVMRRIRFAKTRICADSIFVLFTKGAGNPVILTQEGAEEKLHKKNRQLLSGFVRLRFLVSMNDKIAVVG